MGLGGVPVLTEDLGVRLVFLDDGRVGSIASDDSGGSRRACRGCCRSPCLKSAFFGIALFDLLEVAPLQSGNRTDAEEGLASITTVCVGATTGAVHTTAVAKGRPDTGHTSTTSAVLRHASNWSIVDRQAGKGAGDEKKREGRKPKEPAHDSRLIEPINL